MVPRISLAWLAAMAAALILSGPVAGDAAEWDGVTAAALLIHAFPQSSISLSIRLLCQQENPTTHHCAHRSFALWDGAVQDVEGYEASYGNWTLRIRTPLAQAAVPVWTYETDPMLFEDTARYDFDQENDVLIAVLATHPETLALDLLNAELRQASFGDSHWYKTTDFDGFSAGLGNLPAASAGAGVQWHTRNGTIGFFESFVDPTMQYTRRGPQDAHTCALEFFPLGYCNDFFAEGPGTYSMSVLAQVTTFDNYVAAWSDVRTS
ncbi:MAG TPA: hypothetical protein VGR28_04425 [Candidatus Thermoplasmatota archaeon]|jgi:hypothetical protein|nr:hypothetical protein [Candidatus Thermoplasmatota archaeon]